MGWSFISRRMSLPCIRNHHRLAVKTEHTWCAAKAPIKVLTRHHVINSRGDVDGVHPVEDATTQQGAV